MVATDLLGPHAEPYIAAAVQAAPVFLDPQATVRKAITLIEQAASNGAKLIAFDGATTL